MSATILYMPQQLSCCDMYKIVAERNWYIFKELNIIWSYFPLSCDECLVKFSQVVNISEPAVHINVTG